MEALQKAIAAITFIILLLGIYTLLEVRGLAPKLDDIARGVADIKTGVESLTGWFLPAKYTVTIEPGANATGAVINGRVLVLDDYNFSAAGTYEIARITVDLGTYPINESAPNVGVAIIVDTDTLENYTVNIDVTATNAYVELVKSSGGYYEYRIVPVPPSNATASEYEVRIEFTVKLGISTAPQVSDVYVKVADVRQL